MRATPICPSVICVIMSYSHLSVPLHPSAPIFIWFIVKCEISRISSFACVRTLLNDLADKVQFKIFFLKPKMQSIDFAKIACCIHHPPSPSPLIEKASAIGQLRQRPVHRHCAHWQPTPALLDYSGLGFGEHVGVQLRVRPRSSNMLATGDASRILSF